MIAAAPVRPRHRGQKALLSRGALVEAAIALMRDGGSAGLTMRGVAARLDTGASSLYAWVRNQRELEVLVIDAIASEVEAPENSGSPEEALIALLLDFGRRLFAVPGAAQMALVVQPTGPAYLDLLERALGILESARVDAARATSVLDTLILVVTATVAEQDARAKGPGTDPVDLYDVAIAAQPGRWPHLASAIAELRTIEGEDRLVASLRTCLAGLEHERRR
jgi:AcrR family transcriptional regulator